METVNNNNMQQSTTANSSILAPPMSLPPSLNKNISLTKPPNILASLQQPTDTIASLQTNKLLTQALAKPPSLNLVLNKPISPSPLSQNNVNLSSPSNHAFLTMPKNVLTTNGQLNSPLIGSNLIAQSVKSAELSDLHAPASLFNNSSNTSSKNSSTADLTNVAHLNNQQFNTFSNSMPAASASHIFASLPPPAALNKQPEQTTTQLFQQTNSNVNSTTSKSQVSQSLNHLASSDLFNTNNFVQPPTAPVNQTTTYFQSQSQQPLVNSFTQNDLSSTVTKNQQSTSFLPLNTVSAISANDPFNNVSNLKQNDQPATAPVNSTPFFQPNNNLFNSALNNLFNSAPSSVLNTPNEPQAQVKSTQQVQPQYGNFNNSHNNSNISNAAATTASFFTNTVTPPQQEPVKTTNLFPPPTSLQQQPVLLNQQLQQSSLKPFNQQVTNYFPTPTPTPPPVQQQPMYTPQLIQSQPPVQNGPPYINNAYYQPTPSPLTQQQQQQPYVFNQNAPVQQPAPPPPSTQFNSFNNNNNSNFSTAIRPPPTTSEIANQQLQQQQQQQQQLYNQPNIQPPPINNNNYNFPTLTNQMNNMNLTGMANQTQSPPPPPPPQMGSIPSTGSQPTRQNNQSNISTKNYFINRSQPQSLDLLREKRLIPEYADSEEVVRPQFPHEFYTNVNCHQDTIRCTLTSIPESQNLLSKCRLPLGILIHPFKDLESLKVVQSSTIVRCRNCRSYINPFVQFLDNSKWRCNMCYSINDLPDEFLFDPVTRSYGDPSKRPEINSSTIEFIAPAEYTLRPPPPAMYLYLLDVSHNAVSTGYLQSFCETLLENLDKIPGDSRTQIGFITYNSSLHFYNLSEALSQPRMMIYPDLEELVLPMPDNLMINLNENRESIQIFLNSLPSLFSDSYETDSALGTALSAGYQLLKHTGGRITIMQTCLPNLGLGGLKSREENIDKDSTNLGPQTDFYKKMALDCAGVHIAVDLFMFNSLYSDMATLSCVSKYSGGEIKYYPGYHSENHPEQVIRFCVDFKRYLIRKIGFEAVMRIRCTRGLAIHTFHGNFFVRSTDLLALPNVNPDAGFGMQVAIEENLTDITTVCFQAAVLYTSSKGERRIRIHTYCLPVSKNLNELINGADQEAIIGLVAKMAVDRTTMNSLKEAKDALMNVAVDYLQAYSQLVVSSQKNSALLSPVSLRLIPTYVLALMKNVAFKSVNTKMDDRVYAMNLHKTMPLKYLMLCIYPHLYAIHNLDDKKVIVDSSETEICLPPRLHLSSENIDRHGVYIMDAGEAIYMWIGRSVSDQFLQMVFDCRSFQELPDHSNDLPELDNILSERVRNFLVYLYDSRPFGPTFIYFREDSSKSQLFFQHMHDDKTESSISYYEFLRHLNEQIHN